MSLQTFPSINYRNSEKHVHLRTHRLCHEVRAIEWCKTSFLLSLICETQLSSKQNISELFAQTIAN